MPIVDVWPTFSSQLRRTRVYGQSHAPDGAVARSGHRRPDYYFFGLIRPYTNTDTSPITPPPPIKPPANSAPKPATTDPHTIAVSPIVRPQYCPLFVSATWAVWPLSSRTRLCSDCL